MRDVFDGFRLPELIAELHKSGRLYLIVKEFAAVDLHPDVVSGHDMGYIFEELIRKFAESNNAADTLIVRSRAIVRPAQTGSHSTQDSGRHEWTAPIGIPTVGLPYQGVRLRQRLAVSVLSGNIPFDFSRRGM